MQPRQPDPPGSADPHFNKMPAEKLVYEKFWTTANQEYGRWVEPNKPPPPVLTPALPPNHMAMHSDPTRNSLTHDALYQPYDPRNNRNTPAVLAPAPPQTQRIASAAYSGTERRPVGEAGVVDVSQYAPDPNSAEEFNVNYSNNMADNPECRTDASYREAAPQEVPEHRPPQHFTDEELSKEVDFLGRASKMARSGEANAQFPPRTPAEHYMETVQSRFWKAMQ